MIIDRLTIAPISSPLKARRSFHRGRSTLVHIYARKLNEYESRYERTCESWVQHHQRQVWSLLVRSYNKDAFCRYLRIRSLPLFPLILVSLPPAQSSNISLSVSPSLSILRHLPARRFISLSLSLYSLIPLSPPLSWNLFIFSFISPPSLFHPLSGRTFCFEDSPFERSSGVHPSPSYMYPASLRHVRPSSRFLPPV